MLKVQFSTDNAAFDGEARNLEIGGMLRDLANRIERLECHEGAQWIIRDRNGNRVGTLELSELEETE